MPKYKVLVGSLAGAIIEAPNEIEANRRVRELEGMREAELAPKKLEKL